MEATEQYIGGIYCSVTSGKQYYQLSQRRDVAMPDLLAYIANDIATSQRGKGRTGCVPIHWALYRNGGSVER
jgi:hypothetical protein